MQTRELKVYESANGRRDPCIVLQGKWVSDLGFKKGDKIAIQYDQGQIGVVLIKEPAMHLTL